jgi:hypothetical protein
LTPNIPIISVNPYLITWQTLNISSSKLLRIELWQNDLFHSNIVEQTLNSGSFSWDSSDFDESSGYFVKIVLIDKETVFGISSTFSLSEKAIVINDINDFQIGNTVRITYDKIRLKGSIDLVLYDDGEVGQVIASSHSGVYYDWDTTGIYLNGKYTMKIYCEDYTDETEFFVGYDTSVPDMAIITQPRMYLRDSVDGSQNIGIVTQTLLEQRDSVDGLLDKITITEGLTNPTITKVGDYIVFDYVAPGVVTDYIAYYKFDGNTNDETGNYNATNYGATLTTGVKGVSNTAYYFDGDSSYIERTSFPDITSSSFSVSFWCYLNNDITNYAVLIDKMPNGGGNGFRIQYRDAGYLTIYNGSSNFNTGTIAKNQWVHFTITSSAGNVVWYVNNSTNNTGSLSFSSNSNSLRFGRYQGTGAYHKGNLDDVRLYQRAITSTDVGLIYNNEKP